MQDWIDAVAKRGSAVFYEHQIKVRSESWAHLAHLWSTYTTSDSPTGKPIDRGINSIQAVYDGKQWHVIEIVWQAETPRSRLRRSICHEHCDSSPGGSGEHSRGSARRIAGIAVKTPLVRAPFEGVSGQVWLKAESLQPIGSFKLRGAANKILQLSPEEIRRGVITYSSGNHAQGVAYAAREVGAKAVIVMPSNAPAIKRAATLALGAEVVDVGVASSERLAKCEELVREHGYVVVPPYDDEKVIAGQGTCGLEIVEELADVDLVLSPVSGGGLLSGVATAVKSARGRPECKSLRR